jgi:hypothetical protein
MKTRACLTHCRPLASLASYLPGLDINLLDFSTDFLYPFYTRTIQALTGVRDGQPTCPSNAPVSLTNECAYPDLGLHTDKVSPKCSN